MAVDMCYDRIILGAGIYGLYAARRSGMKNESVLVLEYEDAPFARATYVNQARVHMGYHYPRSLSTALKSAGYYKRFHDDFSFAINGNFKQIYATSSEFSWTAAKQFKAFCDAADIKCETIDPETYFNTGMCDGAFLTEEDTYDAMVLKDYFVNELQMMDNVTVLTGIRLDSIVRDNDQYRINYHDTKRQMAVSAPFVINATYASTNQILGMAGMEPFDIKYELCEIILCTAGEKLKNVGITVMDGPFFSIMPFGKTGYHSLTSVTFTPHLTSFDRLPRFSCQNDNECSPEHLGNCNNCKDHPESAWPYMSRLARKYMRPDLSFDYEKSLYSMKPILKSSEIDDSRPTVIRTDSDSPKFISVLSGKINTVYDLDQYI